VNPESGNKIRIECPHCGASYLYSRQQIADSGVVTCQNCNKPLEARTDEGTILPKAMPLEEREEDYVPWGKRPENIGKSIFQDLPRLFAHGFVLTLIFGVGSLFWIFFLVFFIGFGSIIGLVLGVALMFILTGWINMGLSGYFWSIKSRPDWKALLGHGFALLALLEIVGIPILLLNLMRLMIELVLYIMLQLVILIVYTPIYGFIGRTVALHFEEGKEYEMGEPSETVRRAKCPNCGATYFYEMSSVDSEGRIQCQNCGARFNFPEGPVPSGVGAELE